MSVFVPQHEVDLTEVTAYANADAGSLTRVPNKNELADDEHYPSPFAFVEIKTDIRVSYAVLPFLLPCILCEGIEVISPLQRMSSHEA
jgi:hypothetical protein